MLCLYVLRIQSIHLYLSKRRSEVLVLHQRGNQSKLQLLLLLQEALESGKGAASNVWTFYIYIYVYTYIHYTRLTSNFVLTWRNSDSPLRIACCLSLILTASGFSRGSRT